MYIRPVRFSFPACLLFLSLFLAAPSHSRAQCTSSDFPTPETIAAAPSRPVESSSPDPVAPGVMQTEFGVTHSWFPDSSSQFVMSNLVKLGVWCNVEVRWSANAFLHNSFPSTSVSGFGDNYLTGQYRFHRESRLVPSLALGYTVKFPSANPVAGLGSGQVDQVAMFMAGKTIAKTSVVSNVNVFFIGQSAAGAARKTEWTLNASRSVKGRWGVLGEVYYDSRLNAANAAYWNSTWGVTYSFNPRLILDGGAYVPFTNGPGAPGKSVFFGVTYALGRLYSRGPRHPPAVNE